MGVLNITPDSFSDGGKFLDTHIASKHAMAMLNDGATIIDIGGESSRPYAQTVSLEEELERVVPVIRALKNSQPDVCISIDTYKPEVMSKVLTHGVSMINDIYGFRTCESLAVVAEHSCDICVMHMQGTPQTMQDNPTYANVVDELKLFFETKLEEFARYHIDSNRVIIDPGFGFGKSYEHNIEIIQRLEEFTTFGTKLLIGISNKSIFDKILGGREVSGRVAASTAFNQLAIQKGADIIRTHNPKETSDMIAVLKHTQVIQ